METYTITEKFTLIPKCLYNPNYLGEMFDIGEDESVKSIEIEKYNAVLAFAVPKETPPDKEPLISKLMEYAGTLNEHNKVAVHYCKERKLSHIVAIEGEKLLLANTYRTADITSLLYFLTLAVQQVMFNPQLTRIHVYGLMEESDLKFIGSYFCGAVLNEL